MELAASKSDPASADWGVVALASVVGTIGSFIFMVLPLFIASLVDSGAFTEKQAGVIGAASLLGMFAGSLGFAGIITHISSRAAVVGGSTSLALAYLASLPVAGMFIPLTVIQFLGGVAGVALLSVAFAIIGKTKSPDRNFGVFIAIQMSAGAIGALAIEAIIARYDVQGLLIGMAIFSTLPLFLAGLLPAGKHDKASKTGAAVQNRFAAIAVVLAQVAFGIGIMILWSSVARIGTTRGWDPAFVAQALSLSLFAGIGGAALASVIDKKIPRSWMLIAGTVIVIPGTILTAAAPTPLLFAAGIMVFAFCWNVLPPFQLGLASDLGGSGRVLVLCIAALKLGYSLGTGSSGFLYKSGDFTLTAITASGAFAVSLFLFLACGAKPKKPDAA
jgi:DHA1 family inner membrane transport protein